MHPAREGGSASLFDHFLKKSVEGMYDISVKRSP